MTAEGKTLYIFPGQGSQYRGIGSDLHGEFASVRELYGRASEVLGYDVAALSFEGPEETITLTRHTQPVLLTHHIACLTALREMTSGNLAAPDVTAGHSLGEYSALVAAGVLSFEDGLRLVQKRGELMGEHGAGEMLALPLGLEEARPLIETAYCAVAGCNLKDQTVAGGLAGDLDRLEALVAEHHPRKRAVRLKTEGAFHTYYMVEAARRFRAVLDAATFAEPRGCRVLCNYTGGYHDTGSAESIRTRMFFQLFHPVLWLANLQTALGDGVTRVIEFGGGIGKGEGPAEKRANLESIVKKAQRGADNPAEYLPAINLASLGEAAARLSGGA